MRHALVSGLFVMPTALPAAAQVTLVANGGFDSGLTGWRGQKLDAAGAPVPAPARSRRGQ
jgi:hypothetical protein